MLRDLSHLFILLCLLLTGCSETSRPLKQWEHAVEGAYAAAISRDGRFSVVSSIHHGLSCWDLKDNRLLYQWNQSQTVDNLVLVADISDNSSHAVTANRTDFVLWNLTTGEAEGYWKVRDSNIRDIAVANNGNSILIGKSNGVVVHFEVDTGRRIEFLGHREKINSIDLSANGRYAISGSNDYVAYLWDTQTGQPVHRFVHPSRVTTVALHHAGKFAFTADSKRKASVWELSTGRQVSNLQFPSRSNVFSTVRFSDDGQLLATGAPSRVLALWDTASGKQLQKWFVSPRKDTRPKGAVVYAVAFNPDGTLVTESSAGLAEYWSIN